CNQVMPPRCDARLLVSAGEEDDRQIGPSRLSLNPVQEAGEIVSKQRFLGDYCRCGTGRESADEFRQFATQVRYHTGCLQQLSRCGPVATRWHEDQNAPALALSHHWAEGHWRSRCRDNAACLRKSR